MASFLLNVSERTFFIWRIDNADIHATMKMAAFCLERQWFSAPSQLNCSIYYGCTGLCEIGSCIDTWCRCRQNLQMVGAAGTESSLRRLRILFSSTSWLSFRHPWPLTANQCDLMSLSRDLLGWSHMSSGLSCRYPCNPEWVGQIVAFLRWALRTGFPLAHSSLVEDGEHGRHACLGQGACVWGPVLPGHAHARVFWGYTFERHSTCALGESTGSRSRCHRGECSTRKLGSPSSRR